MTALRLVALSGAPGSPSCLRCRTEAHVAEIGRTARDRPMYACRRCRGPLWPAHSKAATLNLPAVHPSPCGGPGA